MNKFLIALAIILGSVSCQTSNKVNRPNTILFVVDFGGPWKINKDSEEGNVEFYKLDENILEPKYLPTQYPEIDDGMLMDLRFCRKIQLTKNI